MKRTKAIVIGVSFSCSKLASWFFQVTKDGTALRLAGLPGRCLIDAVTAEVGTGPTFSVSRLTRSCDSVETYLGVCYCVGNAL